MTSKEKVLSVHPDANSRHDFASGEVQIIAGGLFYDSWDDAAAQLMFPYCSRAVSDVA